MLLSSGRTLSMSFTAELEELLPRSVTVRLEGSGMSVSADLYTQQEPYSPLEKTPINTFTLRWVWQSDCYECCLLILDISVFKLKSYIYFYSLTLCSVMALKKHILMLLQWAKTYRLCSHSITMLNLRMYSGFVCFLLVDLLGRCEYWYCTLVRSKQTLVWFI